MIAQALAVYKKEMRDMLRDRRMLIAAFSFALLGPAFMGFIAFLTQEDDPVDVKITAAVSYMEQAPGLVAFFERSGLVVSGYTGDAVGETLPEGADALVMLPSTYAEDLKSGKPLSVQVFTDEGSRKGLERGRAVVEILEGYNSYLTVHRMTARGIPTSLLTSVVPSRHDISEKHLAVQLLGDGLAMMFILATFVGGLSVAVDTLAGERERHSMQPLLAQPVTSMAVILGKLGMVSSFSIIGTVLMVATTMTTMSFIPADMLPLSIYIDASTISLLLMQLIPFAIFIAACQLFISIQVKSFKEGQSYISMFMFVPMFVAYLKIYGSAKLPPVANYFPVMTDMESISSLLFTGEFAATNFFISVAISVVGALALTWFTSRKLQSEVLLDAA